MKYLKKENYLTEVKNLIENSKKLDFAVAFWGEKSIELLKKHKNKNSRFICNLESGATNPKAIKSLRKYYGFTFKTNDKLHAKVIIGDNKIIIGSANISANGLSYEYDDNSGWQEAGVILNDKKIIKDSGIWFEELFDKSEEITDDKIKEAIKYWKERQKLKEKERKDKEKNRKIRINNLKIGNRQGWVFIANEDNYKWEKLNKKNESWNSHDNKKRRSRNSEPLRQITKDTLIFGYRAKRKNGICALGKVVRNTVNSNEEGIIEVTKYDKDVMIQNMLTYKELKDYYLFENTFSNLQLTFIKLSTNQTKKLLKLILTKNGYLLKHFE